MIYLMLRKIVKMKVSLGTKDNLSTVKTGNPDKE